MIVEVRPETNLVEPGAIETVNYVVLGRSRPRPRGGSSPDIYVGVQGAPHDAASPVYGTCSPMA